jgi:hypothetical protein
MLVESLYSSKAERERWATLLMDKYNCPGVYMSRSGVLALYANARATGLSVDLGYGGCTLTPVQEGFPLMMGARRIPYGGEAMDERIDYQMYELNGDAYRAACLAGAPPSVLWSPTAAAYRRACLSGLARDAVGVCTADEEAAQAVLGSTCSYSLPDGGSLIVGDNRRRCYEPLFGSPHGPVGASPGPGVTLQDSIVATVMACDPELRQDLFSNIVLAGGVSCAPGLPERLAAEVQAVMPPGLKARVAYAAPGERLHGAWLGGSILASLDSFQDFLFTKEEYQEKGAAAIHKAM